MDYCVDEERANVCVSCGFIPTARVPVCGNKYCSKNIRYSPAMSDKLRTKLRKQAYRREHSLHLPRFDPWGGNRNFFKDDDMLY